MATLRAIDGRVADYVRVPRYAVAEAAIEAQAISDELDRELAKAYAYCWANKRTRALVVISGLQMSVAGVRRTFNELAGIVEGLPSDPGDELAAPRAA